MSVSLRSQLRLVANVPPRIVPKFELQQAYCADRHTLLLAGELDFATAPQLAAAVVHIPMGASTMLVVGLREVTFIDCAGIRAVLLIQELCAQRGCGFSLVPGCAPVQRSFELCGLLDHLPFRDDGSYVGSDLSGATSPVGAAPDLARGGGRSPSPPRAR